MTEKPDVLETPIAAQHGSFATGNGALMIAALFLPFIQVCDNSHITGAEMIQFPPITSSAVVALLSVWAGLHLLVSNRPQLGVEMIRSTLAGFGGTVLLVLGLPALIEGGADELRIGYWLFLAGNVAVVFQVGALLSAAAPERRKPWVILSGLAAAMALVFSAWTIIINLMET
ncbi:MAG: hypothetical protein AAFV53_10025 [Myxococcota bacterium]